MPSLLLNTVTSALGVVQGEDAVTSQTLADSEQVCTSSNGLISCTTTFTHMTICQEEEEQEQPELQPELPLDSPDRPNTLTEGILDVLVRIC